MTERYGAFIPAAPCFSSGSLGGGGVFRDYGFAMNALVGMELRCDGENGDLELFKGVEAFSPLRAFTVGYVKPTVILQYIRKSQKCSSISFSIPTLVYIC